MWADVADIHVSGLGEVVEVVHSGANHSDLGEFGIGLDEIKAATQWSVGRAVDAETPAAAGSGSTPLSDGVR